MSLTKISAVTAALAAILNVAVLLGVDLTGDQLAGINAAIVAIGSAVHIWATRAHPSGIADIPLIRMKGYGHVCCVGRCWKNRKGHHRRAASA